MDAPDADAGREAGATTRERLYALAETQGWAHHVGDLARGEVATTLLDRPVTPRGRLERLAHLGGLFDVTWVGEPSVQLTARRPWQTSPSAYLAAFNANVYLPFDDSIVWEVPPQHAGSPLRGIYFVAESPTEPSILSVLLSAKAWPGRQAQVEVVVGGLGPRARIPVGETFRSHTVDLAVPAGGLGGLEGDVVIGGGVELLVFRRLTFGRGFIVHPPLFE